MTDIDKLLADAFNCDEHVTVSEVSELFTEVLRALMEDKSVSKRNINIFLQTLTATFLSTLYAYAAFDTPEERMKYAESIEAIAASLVDENKLN